MWTDIKEWVLERSYNTMALAGFLLYIFAFIMKYSFDLAIESVYIFIPMFLMTGLWCYSAWRMHRYPKGAKHRYKSYYLIMVISSSILLSLLVQITR